MPLTTYTGTLGITGAAHLLRRAAFGGNPSEIQAFASMTPAAAMNVLFRTSLPAPPLPIDPATGLEWINNPADEDADLTSMFKSWFIGQMMANGVSPSIAIPYSAREKVVWFLHTHFTAIADKINNARYLYWQNVLLRLFALDGNVADPDHNIKTLTKKISVDNAMLVLLDGIQNVSGNPNENYARELLELYTIGRGLEVTDYFSPLVPDNTNYTDYIVYTEQDVQAAARVLTGWQDDETLSNFDPDTGLPRGLVKGAPTNASQHTEDDKIFSNRLANTVINADPLLMNGGAHTEASMLDEIDQLVELIYSRPETARNICRKIYRFYMTAGHDEAEILAIETAAIDSMVTTLQSNNYKIQPVIEQLLTSTHFYEGAAGLTDDGYGSLIKSPVDLVLGTIKFFNIQIPTMSADPTGFYDATGNSGGSVRRYISDMGLYLYEPYDVAGYEAYHQFPMYHRNWITVNYLANRYKFINEILDFGNPAMRPLEVDLIPFIQTYFNGVAPNATNLLLEVIPYILPVTNALTFDGAADDNSGLTAARLNYFLEEFLFDGVADPQDYWTNTLWGPQTNLADIRANLKNMFDALMQSPEYQLA